MKAGERIYRYAVATRLSHWLWVIAFAAMVSSGLQIFNAAPFLDASDATNAAHQVFALPQPADGSPAVPGWLTIPSYRDLADGRRWHLFFAWVMIICGVTWFVSSAIKGNLRELFVGKTGVYNPMQRVSYIVVIFVLAPIMVLTGLALSPGIDAIAHPLTWIFGGRQFARLWHFATMLALIGFFLVHVFQVATHGVLNQLNSMITGWYRNEA